MNVLDRNALVIVTVTAGVLLAVPCTRGFLVEWAVTVAQVLWYLSLLCWSFATS